MVVIMQTGEVIQQVRKSKGLSQAQLAKDIMSRSNLSNFENGVYTPAFDKVLALLKRLNLSFAELTQMAADDNLHLKELEEEKIAVENQGTNEQLMALAKKVEKLAVTDIRFRFTSFQQHYPSTQSRPI